MVGIKRSWHARRALTPVSVSKCDRWIAVRTSVSVMRCAEFAALARVESIGLTFVDAHLSNFCCFPNGPARKLIDLESLHPIRLAFEPDGPPEAHTPVPVPAVYARFLRGFGSEAHSAALRSFFTSVLHDKLERSLLKELKEIVAAAEAAPPTRRLVSESADELRYEISRRFPHPFVKGWLDEPPEQAKGK